MAKKNNQETAERELLDLMGSEDPPDFTLTVKCKDGHWRVRTSGPNERDDGTVGGGESFAEAWHKQEAWWRAVPDSVP